MSYAGQIPTQWGYARFQGGGPLDGKDQLVDTSEFYRGPTPMPVEEYSCEVPYEGYTERYTYRRHVSMAGRAWYMLVRAEILCDEYPAPDMYMPSETYRSYR